MLEAASFFLFGAFAKLRKATVSFVMSVRLSVCLPARDNSASTGWVFMKFDIWAFFEKTVEKIQVSLKSATNNGYFTWRPMYIFDQVSLNFS